MRYYSLKITNSSGGPPSRNFPVVRGALVAGSNFTSWANGANVRGALKVELDISVYPYAVPRGGSRVQVWGVSLEQIGQASDLNGKLIEVHGGLQSGLPLASDSARSKQPGLLVKGSIFQAYGNWIDVEQTLDMIIYPFNSTEKLNLTHEMPAGTTLQSAIQRTLSVGLPGKTINFNISPNLILPRYDWHVCDNLVSYAKYIQALSQSINTSPSYPGVNICPIKDTISVFDGATQTSEPKQILFQELIGQPTWLGPFKVSFKTPMRHDIDPTQYVVLPKTVFTTTQQSLSLLRTGVVFQGTFLVTSVRHVGDSTSSDAGAWVTVFEAVSVPEGTPVSSGAITGIQ